MNKIFNCFKEAVPASWKSTKWLLKLMIPISLAVTLMQHFEILAWIATWINPLFVHFGLPGESAVAFISGATAGTYAGIAAMMSLPLTMKQASILALMIALCHALPMECAVNRKTGSSFWKMGAIRIVMALICAFCLNIILPDMQEKYIYLGAEADSSFWEVMKIWGVSQIKMSLMVVLIIYSLMVVQRLLEAYRLLDPLSRLLSPLMKLFGLPRHASYMWLVGNVLGISYGSAVMVELEEKGLVTREEANDVNYHLIMNHSMLEDTIVFAATGISALLLITTRLCFALLLVWGRRIAKTAI
ncbi:MAG: nucleoside recognition domain-containing protein [Prevotella sp.]|nr:nucleoside recognition domain-containing protein [Prevotella sp.]